MCIRLPLEVYPLMPMPMTSSLKITHMAVFQFLRQTISMVIYGLVRRLIAAGFLVDWYHDGNTARVHTSKVGAKLELKADNSVTQVTFDGATGSQFAEFANDIGLKSDSSKLYFGADNDVHITHTADVGLTLNKELAIGGGSNLNVANHFTVDVASDSRYVRLTLDNNSSGANSYSVHSIGDGDSANGSFGIYNDTGAAWVLKIDGNANATFYGDIRTSTAGTSNFVAGANAGNSIQSGGNYNTTVGDAAGTAITTGDGNTVVGNDALYTTTTGSYNSALGLSAMYLNTTGGYNVAIGRDALKANTTASYNTAVGNDSLTANTTGAYNTASGYSALIANTTASHNAAFGAYALNANTTGAI
jgi:hypothetical protein